MKQRGDNGQYIGNAMKKCIYMPDKPWRKELRRWEEALPRLEECDLEKASRMYKAKTGVGCDRGILGEGGAE